MESLSATSCQKVVASCLNFKCEILVTEKDLKKASTLGTHVKSMNFFYSMLSNSAEMDLVSNRCTEVESFCSEDLEKDAGQHMNFSAP